MKTKGIWVFLLIIVLLSILSVYHPRLTGKSIVYSSVEYQKETVFIARIIDSDTF